jgi:hypothetical protein
MDELRALQAERTAGIENLQYTSTSEFVVLDEMIVGSHDEEAGVIPMSRQTTIAEDRSRIEEYRYPKRPLDAPALSVAPNEIRHWTTVYDGKQNKNLRRRPRGESGTPHQATIAPEHEAPMSLETGVATWWAQEVPPYLADGRCEVLRRENGMLVLGTPPSDAAGDGPSGPNRGREEYYLDPDRGYVPVQWRTYGSHDTVLASAQIDYRDSEFGPSPEHFEFTLFNPATGDVLQAMTSDIESFAFNVPIDETFFQLEFPAGTIVHDTVLNVDYMVGEDGEPIYDWREQAEEMEASEARDDPVEEPDEPTAPTAPPQGTAPTAGRVTSSSPLWIVAATLLVLVIAGAGLWLGRRRLAK